MKRNALAEQHEPACFLRGAPAMPNSTNGGRRCELSAWRALSD